MLSSRSRKVTTYGRKNHRITSARDKPSIDIELSPDDDNRSSSDSGRNVELTGTMHSISQTRNAKKYSAHRKPKQATSDDVDTQTRIKFLRQPLAECTTNIPSTSYKSCSKGKSKASLLSPAARKTTIDITIVNTLGKQVDSEKRVLKSSKSGGKAQSNTTATRRNQKAPGSPERRRSLAHNNTKLLSNLDISSDDDYVPQRPRRQSNRTVKTATQNSSTSRQGMRVTECQGTRKLPATVVSHKLSCSPRKPALVKGSVQMIVLSDSDSESEDGEFEQLQTGPRKRLEPITTTFDLRSQPSAIEFVSSGKSPLRSPKDSLDPKSSTTKATSNNTSQARFSKKDSLPFINLTRHDVHSGATLVETVHTSSHGFGEDTYNDSISIDDELRLALELAEVELQSQSEDESIARGRSTKSHSKNDVKGADLMPKRTSPNLRPLLFECGQIIPFEFASFVETFPVDPIVSFSDPNLPLGKSHSSYEKIGEASYSEVFGIGNVVLKIIPLLVDDLDISLLWNAPNDPPSSSGVEDVLNEIRITRTMGEICKGFTRLLRAYVVQGPYPDTLLTLWDEFDSKRGSESVRPDSFSKDQFFAVIVLPNGGPDLETHSFGKSPTAWRQACSIFWQVTRCLAEAEELVHFEHRDLHWGQILIQKIKRKLLVIDGQTQYMDDPSCGVRCTIIDLGLARIDGGHGDVSWTSPEDEIFAGEGDYQYDVYRMMRAHNMGNWRAFRPLTNVLWLHYLVIKLLHHKHIPRPNGLTKGRDKTPKSSEALDLSLEVKKAYLCLLKVEELLRQVLLAQGDFPGNKLPRTLLNMGYHDSDGSISSSFCIESAADVLRFGKLKCWIK